MTAHHFGEAEVTLPPGWEDQSVTSFVLPRPGGDGAAAAAGAATLVVTRDYASARALPAGEEFLERYADRQLAEAARRLTAYEPLGRAPGLVGGRRALVADAAWSLPNGWRLRQRQAFVRLADRVVVLTLTALAEEFEGYAPLWAEVTASLRWRPGAGLPAVAFRPPAPGVTPGGVPGGSAGA